jgi:hypothetical protein
LLNSERIRLKFGSYGVEVLKSGPALRVTNLYSVSGDAKITRTFALVRFPNYIDSTLVQEHNKILAGGSIGEVFKASNWKIIKENYTLGQLPLPKITGRFTL